MKNTGQKGTIVERRAIRILRSQGYVVHRAHRSTYPWKGTRRSKQNDVFGCVDLIAKPSALKVVDDARTRWIQVTAGRNVGRKRRKLAQVPWNVMHDSVEIWRFIDGTGRKTDGRNGKLRARLYFQVYRRDDGYALHKDRRIDARLPARKRVA